MKNKNHAWLYRICNWSVCAKCGLIALANRKTRVAMQKACPGRDEVEND